MSRAEPLRVAVMTAFVHEDWHSARLLAALGRIADARAYDPAELSAQMGGGEIRFSAGGEDARGIDAFVLARGLSPRGDAEVQFALYRALEESGALLVNRIGPLLDAQDKMRSSLVLSRAGLRTPPAAVAQTEAAALAALRQLGELVAKPLSGSLGIGVERIEPGRRGEERLRSRLAEEGVLYLQQFVPNDGWDVRAFVVGGRLAGAVARVAAPGEFRTNVARGGRARPVEIGGEAARLAERSAAVLGLDYSGVDLVEGPRGPEVIEVNGNPAFDMILEATGQDMAEVIAEHVARRARERRQEGPRRGPLAAGAGCA